MSGQPNWGALEAQGRCKAIGVPWSEKELYALYTLKIPVEFVRNGVTTLEEYKAESEEVEVQVVKTGRRPLRYMNKPELMAIATQLEIPVLTDAINKAELVNLITNAESKLPTSDAGSKES